MLTLPRCRPSCLAVHEDEDLPLYGGSKYVYSNIMYRLLGYQLPALHLRA